MRDWSTVGNRYCSSKSHISVSPPCCGCHPAVAIPSRIPPPSNTQTLTKHPQFQMISNSHCQPITITPPTPLTELSSAAKTGVSLKPLTTNYTKLRKWEPISSIRAIASHHSPHSLLPNYPQQANYRTPLIKSRPQRQTKNLPRWSGDLGPGRRAKSEGVGGKREEEEGRKRDVCDNGQVTRITGEGKARRWMKDASDGVRCLLPFAKTLRNSVRACFPSPFLRLPSSSSSFFSPGVLARSLAAPSDVPQSASGIWERCSQSGVGSGRSCWGVVLRTAVPRILFQSSVGNI